ncbi:MAG: response regulator [Arcicella sp.]|nr:response regulator [Arcicella sp.]
MKILVIEDEAKTVQLTKQGLEEQLWEVDVAYDGLIGLQLATRNTYAIIISDIILPGMSGLELCRQPPQSLGSCRVTLISKPSGRS